MEWVTSPEVCLQRLQPNTALDVLRSDSPSFAKMSVFFGDNGPIVTKAILTIIINDLVNFFSVGKTMNASQVAQTVSLILKNYILYKPDDFKLCFDRAKEGYYGTTYDRVDGNVILGWLMRYDFEKSDEIEDYRINEKNLIESGKTPISADQKLIDNPEAVPMPDYIKEVIHSIATKKILPVKERVKTQAEIVIEGFVADFNDLYEKYGDPGHGKIVAFHGVPGKGMTISEYIECRALLYENGIDDPMFTETLEECVEVLKKYEAERRRKVRDRQNKKL